MTDMNRLRIPIHGVKTGCTQQDHGTKSGNVTVHFRNLERQLIGYIGNAKSVVGCIAWMTSEAILNALGQVETGVAIVVQKEDYLRKEASDKEDYLQKRRNLYDKIRNQAWLSSSMIGGTLTRMYYGPEYCLEGDMASAGYRVDEIDPIRCVGNFAPGPASPRMHNKFLVFCNHDANWPPTLLPYAVWTGSFNFTGTANKSFENAVFIEDEEIARAYLHEFSQISAFAEAIDWKETAVAPELRMS